MVENRWFRLRRPDAPRGLPLRRARPADASRRATATSAATTSRCTSTTSTPPSTTCATHGVEVLDGPDRQPRARPRATGGSTSCSPWGMQFELVSYPDGKAWDRENPRAMSDDDGHATVATSAAPGSRPTSARRSWAASSARATGSARRRSPSGSAPAGCRCARRCGCSRPRGSPSTRPTRAPGCRGCRQHEVDVIYRMRERLEPLALAESLPQLDPDDHARLEEVQQRIEDNDDLEKFLDLDREFHMLTYTGCRHRPADDQRDPAVELHPALPPRLRRARRPQPDVGRQRRAPADPRRRRTAATPTTRERFLGGHIRRTRIELAHHPEVFADRDRLRRVNGDAVDGRPATRTPRC